MLGYHTVLFFALGCLSAIVAASPLPVPYARTGHKLVPIVREGENAFESDTNKRSTFFFNHFVEHTVVPYNKQQEHTTSSSPSSSSSSSSSSACITASLDPLLVHWTKDFYGRFIVERPRTTVTDCHDPNQDRPKKASILSALRNRERVVAPAAILFVMLWVALLGVGLVEAVSYLWEKWAGTEEVPLTEGEEDEDIWDDVTIGAVPMEHDDEECIGLGDVKVCIY